MSNTPQSPAHRILVAEDSEAISDVVTTALSFQGHAVTSVADGHQALTSALAQPADLIVLDVMLPGIDGLEVCRRLRATGSTTPILFLTALAEPEDRIRGFATGGDDYLTKPFTVDELVFRVAAILRRTNPTAAPSMLQVGSLTLDLAGHQARRAGKPVDLSATEFRLLHYLMSNRGVVLSKAQILLEVWQDDFTGSENVVELYIGYLRRKLDDGHPPLIHTRRGIGYVLREDAP
ncbi:two-component system OmpR family response regulator [Salinibacterium amurskyense]|uniref:Two-component system OmpR family response regulator n=1 Tax=Salinibacterium amurskyense TaxID=205941 RepID=A0A2M9D259_9MICO|nr:response regulator transcription factor [Salinibacterium amurskyense]PJJ78272.1 two-component system OmpR family response regulator [Salinibacterium amurskyense]RLQ80385.1 DNA-binding response regulator [Salinibacterium amurskyense]GHD83540.1 DNA-binding response regulator [Salinibacterium amurskyense]